MTRWSIVLLLFASTAQAQCLCCGNATEDKPGHSVLETGSAIKVYIQPGRAMRGLSVAETHHKLKLGFQEIAEKCGVSFVYQNKKGGARIKIEFRGKDSVMQSGSNANGPVYALGKAWTSGRIAILTERDIPNIKNRQIVQAVLIHEFMHVYGWKHPIESNDPRIGTSVYRERIMHPWLTSEYLSPHETRELQAKWGRPSSRFWPDKQSVIGTNLQSRIPTFNEKLARFWKSIDQRTAIANAGQWTPSHPINKTVGDLHRWVTNESKALGDLSTQWWSENRKWQSVPGAITAR